MSTLPKGWTRKVTQTGEDNIFKLYITESFESTLSYLEKISPVIRKSDRQAGINLSLSNDCLYVGLNGLGEDKDLEEYIAIAHSMENAIQNNS